MAKITINGASVVLTSDLQLDDIKKIKKYRPEALVIYEGEGKDKEPVFRVDTVNGAGTLTKYGAEFSATTHDVLGRAVITMGLPPIKEGATQEDVKAAVADVVGPALHYVQQIEAAAQEITDAIDQELAEVIANIVII